MKLPALGFLAEDDPALRVDGQRAAGEEEAS
jgi:hypothetical protein